LIGDYFHSSTFFDGVTEGDYLTTDAGGSYRCCSSYYYSSAGRGDGGRGRFGCIPGTAARRR
jgi:hypothetical protein